jgi:hypothetical protein
MEGFGLFAPSLLELPFLSLLDEQGGFFCLLKVSAANAAAYHKTKMSMHLSNFFFNSHSIDCEHSLNIKTKN